MTTDPKRMTMDPVAKAVWDLHLLLCRRPDGLGAAYENWRRGLRDGLAKIKRARVLREVTNADRT